jgi:hypothetical protein
VYTHPINANHNYALFYNIVTRTQSKIDKGKGIGISLQAWTSPEGFRRLRLPDFKTIGT